MVRDWTSRTRLAAVLAVLVVAAAPVKVWADDADALHQRAISEYQQQAWSNAAESFRVFALEHSSDPRAVDAVFLQAESLHAAKQFAAATKSFGKYLNLLSTGENESSVDTANYVSRAMFRRGESAFFASRTESSSEQQIDFAQLGRESLMRFLANEAVLQFCGQIPNHTLRPSAVQLLSVLTTGDSAKFRAVVESVRQDVAADNSEAAWRRIRDFLMSDPPEPMRTKAQFLAGQVAALQGDWPNARDRMADCQRIETRQSLSPREIVDAQFWYAESLFRLRSVREQARPCPIQAAFEAAAQQSESPWAATVALRLAQLSADRGEWDNAIKQAGSIATRYPDFESQFEADYLIGCGLHTRGHLDQARRAFRRSVDHPNADGTRTAAMAQFRIGAAFQHQGRFDEALNEYMRVVVLHEWPEWQALSLLDAGSCYQALQRRRTAVETYTRVMSDYADWTWASDEAARRLAEIDSPATQATKQHGLGAQAASLSSVPRPATRRSR